MDKKTKRRIRTDMAHLIIQTDFGTGSSSVSAMHGVAAVVDPDLRVDDGNNDVALAHFVREYPEIEEICFCVDNDKGGERAIESYAQKYKDMGYIVTREIPKLKDFNDDLVNMVRPHPNIMRR